MSDKKGEDWLIPTKYTKFTFGGHKAQEFLGGKGKGTKTVYSM